MLQRLVAVQTGTTAMEDGGEAPPKATNGVTTRPSQPPSGHRPPKVKTLVCEEARTPTSTAALSQ